MKTLLPLFLSHTPAGSSTNQLIHYGQEVVSGHFRKYDYGRIGNMRKYKRRSPPNYNLNNCKAPIAAYYSQNDWLADLDDAMILISKLPNVVNAYNVPHSTFNHMDFVWGTDATTLLYDEIIRTMKANDVQTTDLKTRTEKIENDNAGISLNINIETILSFNFQIDLNDLPTEIKKCFETL